MSDRPDNANTECVGPQSDAAGKAAGCEGCPNQSLCASGEAKKPDPAIAEVKDRLSNIKHKILVLSGKGGVGKSSISSQLSWYLSDNNYSTGVLDIDICGPSIPRMLGVEKDEVKRSNYGWSPVYASDNLAVMSVGFMLQSRDDAIIWRGPRKNGLIKQFLTEVYWDDLDFLIVDAPPGTSDEHISIATYMKDAAIDGAIIVTTPQEVSLLDVRKEITFCKKVGIPILGVIENMSGFICPGCSASTDIFPAITGGAEKMCSEMNIKFLGSVPLDPELLKSCEAGQSFTAKFPSRPAAKQLTHVFNTVLSSNPYLNQTVQDHKKSMAEESQEPMGDDQIGERNGHSEKGEEERNGKKQPSYAELQEENEKLKQLVRQLQQQRQSS
jgi:Mrp family chromosome partitioning ATPase